MGRTVRTRENQEPEEQTQAIRTRIADPPRAEGPSSHTHTRSDLIDQALGPSGSDSYKGSIYAGRIMNSEMAGKMEDRGGRHKVMEWGVGHVDAPVIGRGPSSPGGTASCEARVFCSGFWMLYFGLSVPSLWEGPFRTPRGLLFRSMGCSDSAPHEPHGNDDRHDDDEDDEDD